MSWCTGVQASQCSLGKLARLTSDIGSKLCVRYTIMNAEGPKDIIVIQRRKRTVHLQEQ